MRVEPPTLATQRLVLRGAWDERDVAPMTAFYATDPGARYVGGPLDADLSWRALAGRIGHWQLRGFGLFVIEEKANGAWLGWCGLWQPIVFPEIEMSYALAEAHHDKGYMTEAATAVKRYAFETRKLDTLVSYIVPENAASQRVATRLGARKDGQTTIKATTVDVWRYPHPGGAA
jgi:RimJ/RimL family protein N-acetyltransferase